MTTSTGGGWAQLRQQARSLETQVQTIFLTPLFLAKSVANTSTLTNIDRKPFSYILAICVHVTAPRETVGRTAKGRGPNPGTPRKGTDLSPQHIQPKNSVY